MATFFCKNECTSWEYFRHMLTRPGTNTLAYRCLNDNDDAGDDGKNVFNGDARIDN